jgi:hypothetical protein
MSERRTPCIASVGLKKNFILAYMKVERIILNNILRICNLFQVMAFNNSKPNKTVITNENRNPNKMEASLVDPSWEYIDPTPDVHALFIQFNKTFFWNELKHVEVRWSPRMTS